MEFSVFIYFYIISWIPIKFVNRQESVTILRDTAEDITVCSITCVQRAAIPCHSWEQNLGLLVNLPLPGHTDSPFLHNCWLWAWSLLSLCQVREVQWTAVVRAMALKEVCHGFQRRNFSSLVFWILNDRSKIAFYLNLCFEFLFMIISEFSHEYAIIMSQTSATSWQVRKQ